MLEIITYLAYLIVCLSTGPLVTQSLVCHCLILTELLEDSDTFELCTFKID